MQIEPYTFGMGDRFTRQGEAQLSAVAAANAAGIHVTPVWNKSNREHSIVGTTPDSVRTEADAAVAALGWKGAYHVDADHIALNTVDPYLEGSDFFTLDVAEHVGRRPEAKDIEAFLKNAERYLGELRIPGIDKSFNLTREGLTATAGKFLAAAKQAGRIYRYIADHKGADNFITEVSIDETDQAQTPVELFLILVMLAAENVPVQTIAPKFTGRFNKGVDYVGDVAAFAREFDEDLHVIAYAISELGFPETLKLSVHSGSDKFSIYPVIREALKRHGCGLHVKTAGTTWLEEVIGLAEAGGDGLALAREIYAGAHARFDELTGPYATVVDIDRTALPSPEEVNQWNAATFVESLRHDLKNPHYNANLRQLLHVGFKVAAELGERYTAALETHRESVARNVRTNLLERHIKPIFPV